MCVCEMIWTGEQSKAVHKILEAAMSQQPNSGDSSWCPFTPVEDHGRWRSAQDPVRERG